MDSSSGILEETPSQQQTPRKSGHWLAAELGPTFRLAGPVVASELGWMLMGTVDTLMVGPLGPEAVGAVGLGSSLFFAAFVFPMGLLLGLDPMVSQAFGAGDREDCRRTLWHGLYLGILMTPLAMLAMLALVPALPGLGIHPDVLGPTGPYLRALAWGVGPLLVFTALRHYLQAMGRVGAMVAALAIGNLLNLAGNWVFIYGHWGFPVLGVEGSGWSTTVSRVVMPLILVADACRISPRRGQGWRGFLARPEWSRFRRLMRLGLPAAVHLSLEVGVFSISTMLAGRLAPAALAAHQIVLNLASTTFMVPLGIASAGSVRVGQAIGRRDPLGAKHAGWTSLILGAGFMALAGLVMSLAPRWLVGQFSDDHEVLRIGVGLIFVAAIFQLFDGIQVVSTGILRGAGETKLPMVANLIAHWTIGLPIGYLLGLRFGWGAQGLWIGLSAGLIAAALFLLVVWARKAGELASVEPIA